MIREAPQIRTSLNTTLALEEVGHGNVIEIHRQTCKENVYTEKCSEFSW